MVREELRELQEQQKRRTSLVIRGLGAGSAADAVRAFETVSEHLIDQKVTLTDVVKIPSESDLYRAKVADDSVRKNILDRARQLKNSTRFGSVFIRRDLTFNQRAEFRARRAAAEAASGTDRRAAGMMPPTGAGEQPNNSRGAPADASSGPLRVIIPDPAGADADQTSQTNSSSSPLRVIIPDLTGADAGSSQTHPTPPEVSNE